MPRDVCALTFTLSEVRRAPTASRPDRRVKRSAPPSDRNVSDGSASPCRIGDLTENNLSPVGRVYYAASRHVRLQARRRPSFLDG